MVLLIEIITIALLLIFLWFGVNYLILNICKYKADKIFFELFKGLKEEYEIIDSLLTQNTVFPPDKQTLSSDTKRYISQALNFSVEKDGNERIIGYANAILENIQILTNTLTDNTDNSILNKYFSIQKKSAKLIDNYNKSAKDLKHYVDVFPSSFLARLKRISTMDFINQ